MKRIDTKTGLFSNGDARKGIPGTVVTAEWCNNIQEEIVSVIGAANLNDTLKDQLLNAIKDLIKTGGVSPTGSTISATDQAKIDSSYLKVKTFIETILGTAINNANATQLLDAVRKLTNVATQAEVDAGLLDNKIVTPKKLKPVSDKLKVEITTLETSIRNKINELAVVDDGLRKDLDKNTGDINNITASVPTIVVATETAKGVAEIATQTEVNAGLLDDKIVTPKKLKPVSDKLKVEITTLETSIRNKINELAVVDDGLRKDLDKNTGDINNITASVPTIVVATETAKGVAEIATQTEVNAGLLDDKIVTPKKLKPVSDKLKVEITTLETSIRNKINELAVVDDGLRKDLDKNTGDINNITASVPTIVVATETAKGIAEIATQAETNIGTDDSRFITPLKLSVVKQDIIANATTIRNTKADLVKVTSTVGKHTTKIAEHENEIQGLKNKDVTIQNATEITKGIAEIATQAEVGTGTLDDKIVTPKKLKAVTQNLDNRVSTIKGGADRNATDIATIKTKNTKQDADIDALKKAKVGDLSKIQAALSRLEKAEIADVTKLQKEIDDFDAGQKKQDKDIVDLKAVQANIAVSDATETTKGVAEIATQAETTIGTDDSRFITPKKIKPVLDLVNNINTTVATHTTNITTNINNIATNTQNITALQNKNIVVVDATETIKGVARIGTIAEVSAGVDNTRIVTPKNLQPIRDKITKNKDDISALERKHNTEIKSATDRISVLKVETDAVVVTSNQNSQDILSLKTGKVSLVDASESTKGIAEIATQTEVNAGLLDDKIVTPKKLKPVSDKLKAEITTLETSIRNKINELEVVDDGLRKDLDRNTADLVTHRTDIRQNITDINATKSNTATNTANITKILGNLANITPTTTANRLVSSFTVPSTLHDKVSLKGEAVAGTYGYDVKVRGDILTVSDPTLQEVVVYRRDKNNKKLFSLEDIHKAKNQGGIYIENSQVHIANADGKHIDVFEYDATKPQLTFNKTHSLTLTNSYGKSIAINKDFLIVSNSEAKTVLVYSHVGRQLWLLVKKLNGAVGFGSRVSMSSEFIYVTQDKQVKVFNLNFTNVKTFRGTAAYKISAEEHLVALLDTGNNLIEVDRDNVPFAKLTIKSNCLDVHGLYLLLVDKTIPKVYVFGIYNKTGWFKTTQTTWTGIPDNKDGYVAYVVKGGDYQLVKPINTTDYYTKFANRGWVKNGGWGAKLYYTASEIGVSKADAGKITITDSGDVVFGFGFVDGDGVLWIAAGATGLGRLDTNTGKIAFTDRSNVYHGFGVVDANGGVWIGTNKDGLAKLDTNTGKITITDSTNVSGSFGVVDANGGVWIGTNKDGLGKLDTNTGKITITDSTSVSGGFGVVDANGGVWIGAGSKGVGKLDTNTGKIAITDRRRVSFGIVDTNRVVWVGAGFKGVGKLDTNTGKIAITDRTRVFYGFGVVDANGGVWIGTDNDGLGRLNTNTGKIAIADRTDIRGGFGIDDGTGVLWIGTQYDGLGFVTSGNDKLYLNTNSGKTFYGSKEVKDSVAFDEIIEHLQPYSYVKPAIELPTRNIRILETDIQEQPNKTGNFVSLLGTSTPRTPQAFDDATFNIDAGYGDACALTANNVLVTNKTDSKLAVYDLKGNKLKEIQLEAGVGSVIDATDKEAFIGSETANKITAINLE